MRLFRRFPESAFGKPSRIPENDLHQMGKEGISTPSSLEATPSVPQQLSKSAKRRLRRKNQETLFKRRSSTRGDFQDRIDHPSALAKVREEFRQACDDLHRIRAEREQLRLELQAFKALCHRKGIKRPHVSPRHERARRLDPKINHHTHQPNWTW